MTFPIANWEAKYGPRAARVTFYLLFIMELKTRRDFVAGLSIGRFEYPELFRSPLDGESYISRIGGNIAKCKSESDEIRLLPSMRGPRNLMFMQVWRYTRRYW